MFRRYRVFILIVTAIVLLVLWYVFRPEKLFINKKVDEAPPAIIIVPIASALTKGPQPSLIQKADLRIVLYEQLV